jgi:DNA repair protein RecO (recombination protein O)
MLIKTKAIVLSTLKYQEKSLIVKCFTLSDGLKTYFVRDAFSGRKSSRNSGTKIAYFQALSILEIEAIHKNKGTLENFKEIKIATPFATLHSDIVKSTIAMFISEMLLWLDTHNEIANFHLIFLLETTKYLGFYPDTTAIDFKFFEMTEGVFSPFNAISSLSEHETNLFKKLIDLKFENTDKNFASTERQILLKILIDYYSFHLDGFKKPKSLDVLKEVFS